MNGLVEVKLLKSAKRGKMAKLRGCGKGKFWKGRPLTPPFPLRNYPTFTPLPNMRYKEFVAVPPVRVSHLCHLSFWVDAIRDSRARYKLASTPLMLFAHAESGFWRPL